MRRRAHGAGVVVRLERRVVQRAQHVVAVLDRVGEGLLVLLAEVGAERLHHGGRERLQLAEQLDVGLLEALDLGGPDVVGVLGAVGMALGQLLADVPELLQVGDLRVLGVLLAERRVAAGAAGDLGILLLDVLGQLEQLLVHVVDAADQGLIHGVTLDRHEAELDQGVAPHLHEALALLGGAVGIVPKVDHGDLGLGTGAHRISISHARNEPKTSRRRRLPLKQAHGLYAPNAAD
ncbi:hypothetical protein D3C72_959350 [compost metagenome]